MEHLHPPVYTKTAALQLLHLLRKKMITTAAKDLGMKTIHLTSEFDLKKRLKELEIKL